MKEQLVSILCRNRTDFYPVIKSAVKPAVVASIDLSGRNKELLSSDFSSVENFEGWINGQLLRQQAAVGMGGYAENRVVYQNSALFAGEEARSVHLGIDIWDKAGTVLYAPLGGMVHSFGFNNQKGDYGATIILQHQLHAFNFYTLYGHLSLADIGGIREGQVISRGEPFAHLGEPHENGNWPPHLHFQLIIDIGNYEGDYPGVCKPSEAEAWLANSPDPSCLLNF